MKKKLTKTICLLGLVSLPTVLALSFVDSKQQNKQKKLQNNRSIGKLANNNNNELIDSNHIIDKPFYILNYAADQKNSVDIYLYGDGYKNNETELKSLYRRAKSTVDYFFSFSQYKQLKNYMNVYLVFTDSKKDGNYSIINKKEDTFFGVFNGKGNILDIEGYGREKIKTLGYQLKNRITRQGENHFSRANIYLDTNADGGVSLRQFSITGGRDIPFTFVHEMSHNFNLDDEYIRGFQPEASPYSPNTTPYNDPNKVQWREFLGYRNIGIYRPYGAGNKFLLPYVSKSFDVVGDACIMQTRESNFFCEVCRWKSFQFINNNFKNKLDYIGFPSITASYNSGNYQQHREELVNEKGQHNTKEIQNNQDKHIDLRTMFYNSKNNAQEIKLKLTIKDKTTTNTIQVTEETFLIQPNQIKQLRLTSNDKLNSTNVELVGEVIDVATSKVLATSQNYWREPKKLIVNFLDNSTNEKIDYISTQTYFYDDSNANFVNEFQGQNLVGYRFKSKIKTMSENGSDTVLNLMYETLKFKEITMNLYDSVDSQIKQTKQWKIFEGETFTPSKYDFLLSSNDILDGEIIFPNNTISYDELTTGTNISLDYIIEYNRNTNFKVKETNKNINLGDDGFDIYSNAIVESKRGNQWVENKYLSNKIIVEENGFNPYKLGTYNIKYQYGNFTKMATIVVVDNNSISSNERNFFDEIKNMTNEPIVANSDGKNVDISKINRDDIQKYVSGWPTNNNGIDVKLEKFEPNIENAWIRLAFKFTKDSFVKTYTTTAIGFNSVEKDLNEVIKWVENEALGKVKVNELGKKTHIDNVTSENIKQYVDNWPQKTGYTFDGIVEDKVAGTLVLCFKVTKDGTNISKISSGMWKGDFLFDEEETENPNPEFPDKFKTLSNEIKKINDSNLEANDKGSKLMANEITIDNLQQNIANFPTIDSSISVSIDFLAISDQQNGGNILVKYKLMSNNLVLYSNFKEIKGFKPDENLMTTINERIVKEEVKRLNEDPPKVNNKGKDTYVKDVKFDFELDDCITNKPIRKNYLAAFTKMVRQDEVNGVIELYWEIQGDDPSAAIYIEKTNTFRIEGFKRDSNGTRPPENNDLKDVENALSELQKNPPKINNLGKQTNISQVTEKNIQNYVDNWPTENNSVKVNIKQFSKNTSKGTITIIFEFSKNNIIKDSTSIAINGFKVDPIQPPDTDDEKDVNDEVNKINNTKFVLNELGKKTVITDNNVNKNTIQNYVDNWPSSNKNISIIVKSDSFIKNIENGSVSFVLQLSKNSVSVDSKKITISGFKINNNPPINDDSSNESLPTWAIVLISISSLVGVGLIGVGIWWFIRKRRYL